jgi:pectate lyase
MIDQAMFTGLIALLACSLAFSKDKPDGFASVSGKGLSATTGGENGKTVTVTTFADLKNYAESSEPYIILVKGRIPAPSKGDAVNVKSNKTIVGLGNDATLYQIELHIIIQKNIIIRNIIDRDSYVEGNYDCKDTDWDGIQADSCHHLWIDHCWFTHNCDGLIDLRKSCDYVTVSWVHLSNHNKAFGLGWTTNTDFRTTIHHCYFDSTNQRNPSFDMGIGHLYNNYVRKVMSYGNLARGEARVIIENSFFENSKNPVQISDNAKLYISGLQFSGCSGTTTGNVTTPPYDIKNYYSYTLDPTDQVKSIVSAGAGPLATIGDQYTGNTAIATDRSLNPGMSLLNVASEGSNFLRIRAAFPGRFSVAVMTASGRIIGRFSGNAPFISKCAIPGPGLYIISLIDDRSGKALRGVLRAYCQ